MRTVSYLLMQRIHTHAYAYACMPVGHIVRHACSISAIYMVDFQDPIGQKSEKNYSLMCSNCHKTSVS